MKKTNRPIVLGLCIAGLAVMIASLYSPSSHADSDNSADSDTTKCSRMIRNTWWDKRHSLNDSELIKGHGVTIFVDACGRTYSEEYKNVVITGSTGDVNLIIETSDTVWVYRE